LNFIIKCSFACAGIFRIKVDPYKDPYKDAKMVHYKAFEQTVHRSRSTVGTLGKYIQEHAEALRAGD
jgi:hypothetical protein